MALAVLAACSRGELDSSMQERLEEATSDATRALDKVSGLESRVDGLSSSLDDLRRDGTRFGADVEKLRESLSDLRSALRGVRSSSSSALSEASSALAVAQQAARDLAVLEQRYEYHLRRYHGGG